MSIFHNEFNTELNAYKDPPFVNSMGPKPISHCSVHCRVISCSVTLKLSASIRHSLGRTLLEMNAVPHGSSATPGVQPRLIKDQPGSSIERSSRLFVRS